jgi:hypothetical protein
MKTVSSQSGTLTRASSKTCFAFPNEDWTKVSDNVVTETYAEPHRSTQISLVLTLPSIELCSQ